jgi:hypothetical protein
MTTAGGVCGPGFREYLAGRLAGAAGSEQDADRAGPGPSRWPGRGTRWCSGCSSSCPSRAGIRTRLAIGSDLAVEARAAGFAFRRGGRRQRLRRPGRVPQRALRGRAAVRDALKPRRGTWAYGPDAHTPGRCRPCAGLGRAGCPGDWHPVARTFRDGHAETWRPADATLGWWGSDGARRLAVATADLSGDTWYTSASATAAFSA